jgi:hypothetical protein
MTDVPECMSRCLNKMKSSNFHMHMTAEPMQWQDWQVTECMDLEGLLTQHNGSAVMSVLCPYSGRDALWLHSARTQDKDAECDQQSAAPVSAGE